jgi:hypothetical protein
MNPVDYFASISRELQHQSERVRESFKTHRPTVGANREALIEKLFEGHLPKAFGTGTGLISAREGILSNQADLVIYDQLFNTPFHSDLPQRIFVVESIYSLIEVKSTLTPAELTDSIKKGRRFKSMRRHYSEVAAPQIEESLFIIFAFDAAQPTTLRDTIALALQEVPTTERPDFIVVANSLVATAGSYLELTKLGQPNSPYRAAIMQRPRDPSLDTVMARGFSISVLGEHTLTAFFIWLTSWLLRAGHRTAELQSYLPRDMSFGYTI